MWLHTPPVAVCFDVVLFGLFLIGLGLRGLRLAGRLVVLAAVPPAAVRFDLRIEVHAPAVCFNVCLGVGLFRAES